MAQKKYVSLSKLQTFLDNLKNKFALKTHTHSKSDISDFVVDTELSSTSTNPVENRVVDAEFEAISQGMNALELAIDDKSDVNHNHDDLYFSLSGWGADKYIGTDESGNIVEKDAPNKITATVLDEVLIFDVSSTISVVNQTLMI